MKRRIMSGLFAVAMILGVLTGGQNGVALAAEENGGEKIPIKFYGKCIEYVSGPMMTDALEEKLADKYDIESIQIDWTNLNKVIRTGIASGEPCDVYNCTPGYTIANFADMALDLTPYLEADPEWKAQFKESDIEACTTPDGKVVNLPWEVNFPVIIANKAVLEEVLGEIPESWNYEVFLAACQKLQDAGYWPFANATDLNRGDWLFEMAVLSEAMTAGKHAEYASEELSYDGEETRRALENVKSLYDNGYMYPGEGAVTVKNDEIKSAFYQGKLAMMTEIAAGAKVTASEADFEVIAIAWPASNEVAAVAGVFNGFFIPSNCANPDAAVEVLKAFTEADIQAIHAREGYIPVNVNVEVDDPFVKSVIAQAANMTREHPTGVAINEYRNTQLMADLILNGGVETTVAGLEAARLADVQ